MKNKTLKLLIGILFILLICTSCVSVGGYIKDDFTFDLKSDRFYILGDGDTNGISYKYKAIMDKGGMNTEIIFDANKPINIDNTKESSGSGFYISDSTIITNAHVVNDSDSVQIIKNGEQFSAKVIYSDKINDLAILQAEKPSDLYFKLIDSRYYDIADPIFVLGYPLFTAMGQNIKVTQGIISSKTGFKDDSNEIQISAPIQAGNSGGPVINYDFAVVGIATASLESTNVQIQNVNYAIKSDIIKLLANLKDVDENCYVKDIQDAMSATVQVLTSNATDTQGNSYLITIEKVYDMPAETNTTLYCKDIATNEVVATTQLYTSTYTEREAKLTACIEFVKSISDYEFTDNEYYLLTKDDTLM